MFYKKGKIIVKLNGGLGNQLFQYYTGLNLAIKYNRILQFDNSKLNKDLLRNYKLSIISETQIIKNSFSQFYNQIFSTKISETEDFSFQEINIQTNKNIILEGYWQNEMYFKDIAGIIFEQFNLVKKYHLTKSDLLNANEVQKIAVHVRRGDYLLKKNKTFHGVLPIIYYLEAIDYFRSKLKKPQFIFFSDDIPWCKKHFDFNDSSFSESGDEWEDLLKMKNCNHFIIANSSYSWWAAWLNDSEDKIIIAPKNWLFDTSKTPVPKSWITL
jgi:hypothetical protein